MRPLATGLMLALLPTAAVAETVACTPVASIRWDTGEPDVHRYDAGGDFGPILFELDLETGEYNEHLVGGRAGISGGGTLDIVPAANADSLGDVVGIDREDGAHFRIRTAARPLAFTRTHPSGEIDIGTCVWGDILDAVEASR